MGRGRRRGSGRRAAAVDQEGGGSLECSPAVPSRSTSGGSIDHKKSPPSDGSTATEATSLSQQTVEGETPSPPPTQDTKALRRRLLGLIRGFYLEAISRLPTAELRDTLARGLLVGGHCFGPLHPVHNIIANSVWYAAAFPLRPADRTEMDALGAQETDRAARRSLDGLVACLLHICPFLSLADALWQLSRSRADLRVAVASVLRAAEPEVVKASFQAAAEAAVHPNPAAFAFFASSVLPDVERDVSRLLVSKSGLSSLDIDRLSSSDIDRLSSVLLPYPLPNELCCSPPDPSPKIIEHISGKKRNLTNWYKYMLGMTNAALCKFTRQTGLHYELHTIYGENLLDDEDYNQYFHINFIAQPKEDHSSSSVGSGHRLFFFAEAPRPAPQEFREEDISMCCLVVPLPWDIDNCHACLIKKHKIIHPVVEPVYHTRVLRFGEQCFEIGKVDHDWVFRPVLAVDYLCFDPDRDSGLVEHLHNHFARVNAFCSNRNGGVKGCRQLV